MVESTKFTPKNQVTGSFDEIEETEDEQLERAILKINGNILGIVIGILLGLLIFIATNWLILRGGEDPGKHLRLLNQFYFGYSVTFVGSLVGSFYGLITGYIIGFSVGWIYNRVVNFKTHSRR